MEPLAVEAQARFPRCSSVWGLTSFSWQHLSKKKKTGSRIDTTKRERTSTSLPSAARKTSRPRATILNHARASAPVPRTTCDDQTDGPVTSHPWSRGSRSATSALGVSVRLMGLCATRRVSNATKRPLVPERVGSNRAVQYRPPAPGVSASSNEGRAGAAMVLGDGGPAPGTGGCCGNGRGERTASGSCFRNSDTISSFCRRQREQVE